MNQRDQPAQITTFLNNYKLSSLDPESTIVESANALYLAKCVRLQGEQNDIEVVLDTLEQHQTLNQNYLLILLSYSLQKNQNNESIVRTLYQYAKTTLREEIINRREMGMYFKQEQLWAIIYSVTRSLEYLQKLGIGYGVLGCDKIFIDKKIKLIDPSAVAQDPLTIVPHRLYSPQILNEEADIDILKSDVFVLGLCILEASLLVDLSSDYDTGRISVNLDEVESMYAGELSGLLRQMLQSSPQDRPSFCQIRQYLQNTLQMTDLSDQYFNPLLPDAEDNENPVDRCDQTDEVQVYDSEEQEEQCCLAASLNQFEKARIRFLNDETAISQIKELSRIDQNSRCSSTFRMQNSQKRGQRSSMLERGQKGVQESRQSQNLQKKQISKHIKDKLIKDMSSLELQVIQVKQYNRASQPRSCERNGSGYNHLFTNPKLMQEIQNQLKNIARNRGYQATKQNIYSGNN